jgi:hypothetical protein
MNYLPAFLVTASERTKQKTPPHCCCCPATASEQTKKKTLPHYANKETQPASPTRFYIYRLESCCVLSTGGFFLAPIYL